MRIAVAEPGRVLVLALPRLHASAEIGVAGDDFDVRAIGTS
jgi:hypothetical protein